MTANSQQLFGLLEMGSNSLKLYLVDMEPLEATIETLKFPWRIAHHFFATGELSPSAAREIVTRLEEARAQSRGLDFSSVLTIATGMFREIDNLDEVTAMVKREVGVRIRVISGADEATLMSRGFRALPLSAPAMLCDLGGATMEWVWLGGAGESTCGSEPLGAIRNQYRFAALASDPATYVSASADHCDRVLAGLPSASSPQLVTTGGTARALALVAASDTVATTTIAELVDRVAEHGPPESVLSPRREVFLPGLIVLWRVALHCGATTLQYGTSAVRHGMVVRLLQLLEKYEPKQLHATQLLRSTQKKL